MSQWSMFDEMSDSPATTLCGRADPIWHARPLACGDAFVWVAADPPDPANGALPQGIFDEIVFLGRFTRYLTLDGALAALHTVLLRNERNLTRDSG